MTINLEKNIDEYKIKGFTKIKNVISKKILLDMQNLIQTWVNDYINLWLSDGSINNDYKQMDFNHRFLNAWLEAGQPFFRRQPNKYLICSEMYDILKNEKILNIASDLLGTDEISVHGIFNARPMLPNTSFTRAPWHQDSQYWHLDYGQKKDDPQKCHVLTMFIPLQDIDENSGCLSLISLEETKNKLLPIQDYGFEKNGYLGLTDSDIKKYSHHVADLNRGDLLCFNHLVPHGTNPLNKDYIRWSVDIRYEPTEIATGLGKKYGFVVNSKNKQNITSKKDWLLKANK